MLQETLPATNPPINEALGYLPGWWSPGGIGNLIRGNGGSGFADGFGLLGCSIPVRDFGSPSNIYGGATCDEAGDDGWRFIATKLVFWQPTDHPDFSGIDVQIFTYEDNIAAYRLAVVPEPGTWALMLVELGALGVVGRRRRV